jgi:hypothetical protein
MKYKGVGQWKKKRHATVNANQSQIQRNHWSSKFFYRNIKITDELRATAQLISCLRHTNSFDIFSRAKAMENTFMEKTAYAWTETWRVKSWASIGKRFKTKNIMIVDGYLFFNSALFIILQRHTWLRNITCFSNNILVYSPLLVLLLCLIC